MRRVLTLLLALSVAIGPVYAEEAAAPSPDDVLHQLMQLDPAALAARLKEMKAKADSLEAEAKKLREQATGLDQQIEGLSSQVEPFMATLKALAEQAGIGAPPAQADAGGEMKDAAMAPEMAPEGGMAPPNAEMAAAPDAPKGPNFADDVLPIFREACLRCHNPDKQRGGLDLETFAATMTGGSSGEVIVPGQADSSRLLRLVTGQEEPEMPPSGLPLSEKQIQILRDWIATGARADANSKVMVAKNAIPESDEPAFIAAKMHDGPPPMPEVDLPQAVNLASDRGVVARAVASSPTSPLVAVGGDKQVILYDMESYALLGALEFPEGDVFTLSFSANGELLLAGGGEEGDSGAAVIWNVRKAERLGVYGEGYDTVLAAGISPDHRMVAVGGPNNVVKVYATGNGQELFKIGEHTDWIYAVEFSYDGELLATADRAGNLFLWQASTGRAVEPLRGHEGAVHDLAFTLDSNVLASAGADGKVMLWDTWEYKRLKNFNAHNGPVLSLDYSATSELVTSGADGLTKRWDSQGTHIKDYPAMPDWTYQTRFAAKGGVVLSGMWNGDITAWNVESGEAVARLTTNPQQDMVVAIAPAEPAESIPQEAP